MSDPTIPIQQRPFRGTQVAGDDGDGPVLVQHRQRLVVVTGPDRGLERDVPGTRLSIGTSDVNDLILSDAMISRRHCEIVVQGDRYLLRDLGSTNGTSVNGTPVVEAFLTPGARIGLGITEILFQPKKKWVKLALSEADHFGELYGRSNAMREVFGLLERVVRTDLSVIIVGETGTGKELVARALHDHGARAEKPFVVVDCGAVSENLIESELFGHERGAFTGADRARAGAFELAHGGTIFLDEIGELLTELQPKLLRALERREVKRLGAPRPIEVDVRVLAATNRELRAEVARGAFREDLYYRLAEVAVQLPPLRDRREDIALIAERFISDQATRAGAGANSISQAAYALLGQRDWPGNVRELRNVLRRAAVLARGDVIEPEDIPESTTSTPAPAPTTDVTGLEGLPIKEARERWNEPLEREYLIRLIRRTGGDLESASVLAGLHRKSLERLLRQHGLRVDDIVAG
ncbi:MAG: sigma 54-interacting transcriptional regulator [Deltaproteobacteria bacterium]|nr:sigma 54-interacting transcriptional regulator [Deltaproteobacteria bacterium]